MPTPRRGRSPLLRRGFSPRSFSLLSYGCCEEGSRKEICPEEGSSEIRLCDAA